MRHFTDTKLTQALLNPINLSRHQTTSYSPIIFFIRHSTDLELSRAIKNGIKIAYQGV